jgi:hypothetical protein
MTEEIGTRTVLDLSRTSEAIASRLLKLDPDQDTKDRFVAWVAARITSPTGDKSQSLDLDEAAEALGLSPTQADILLADPEVQLALRSYMQSITEGQDAFIEAMRFQFMSVARMMARGDELTKDQRLFVRQFAPILYEKNISRDRRNSPGRRYPDEGGARHNHLHLHGDDKPRLADRIASGDVTGDQIERLIELANATGGDDPGGASD